MPRRSRLAAASTAALCLSLLLPVTAGADLSSQMRELLADGEVVYAVGADDRPLLDINGERSFIPASTLKVFTTLLAAQHLGLGSRFATEFFLEDGLLIVRGKGDPFLVSEELDLVAGELREKLGKRALKGILIDDSYFAPGISVPGVGHSLEAYDALNSATAVNFNTVDLKVKRGKIVSGEAQTPLTPLGRELARRYHIKGEQRISLSASPAEVRRYAAELLAAKLRLAGVRVGPRTGEAKAPGGPPFYVHENTRTLRDVCRLMLYHSNNYVANQVFLAVGAAAAGPPATLAKSVAVANRFIAAHPGLRGMVVTEGAGLSYENRVTPPEMTALLSLFAPYKDLLRQKYDTPSKTGSLAVVHTLIGYLDTARHGTVRFVVRLDGNRPDYRPQIVGLLRREL